jgi:hypothetical protein
MFSPISIAFLIAFDTHYSKGGNSTMVFGKPIFGYASYLHSLQILFFQLSFHVELLHTSYKWHIEYMAIIQRANVYFGAVVELITATTSF